MVHVNVLCIVAHYVPAAWISPLILEQCLMRRDPVSLILSQAVDRCAACNMLVVEGSAVATRVEPCGCLVHAPCALDDLVDAMQRFAEGKAWVAASRLCPRCGFPRCTNLEAWMHDMSIVDCRFFTLPW